MVAGLALMAIATGLTGLIVGRVLAGVGGVIVNVIMTKMVVDWFSGAELATAMSILISSWPFGIALALLVLPALASWGGIAVAWAGGTALTLLALLLFVAIYRPAPTSHQGRNSVDLAGLPLLSLGLAGAIWAVYNAALAMVFGFGPILLTENGMSASAGSGIISMFTIFVGLGIFLGGLLVDRFGRRDMFISASFLLSAALLPGLLVAPSASLLWLYALTGFVFGLSAGPVMTLPSEVLVPQARALGMGLFFAIYYGVMMIGPAIGGRLAESTGSTAATFLLASVMLVGCSLALAAFLRESKRQPAA
jgi:MFS family permease